MAFGDPAAERALGQAGALTRFTAQTLTTPEALAEDLSRIRSRGFALDNEERTPGMRCIAAPVFDMSGAAVAGLSVSGPAHRVGPEHLKTLGAAVAEAARELSVALGA